MLRDSFQQTLNPTRPGLQLVTPGSARLPSSGDHQPARTDLGNVPASRTGSLLLEPHIDAPFVVAVGTLQRFYVAVQLFQAYGAFLSVID